jgi:hypothetical protein
MTRRSRGNQTAAFKGRVALLACVLASIAPLPMRAQDDSSNAQAAAYSCFGPPNYCIKTLPKTHDRDYYELCMVSERICLDYRHNWEFARSLLREDHNAVLNDSFPEAVQEGPARNMTSVQSNRRRDATKRARRHRYRRESRSSHTVNKGVISLR